MFDSMLDPFPDNINMNLITGGTPQFLKDSRDEFFEVFASPTVFLKSGGMSFKDFEHILDFGKSLKRQLVLGTVKPDDLVVKTASGFEVRMANATAVELHNLSDVGL